MSTRDRPRVNVRCPACGWNTSRRPKGDQRYGQCPRCWATVVEARSRTYVNRATPTPLTRYHTQFATWPELVAAEMQRLEDGNAKS